jgi:hypothetical protein
LRSAGWNDDESGLRFSVEAPGRYRLVYGYSGSSLEFEVPEVSFVGLVRVSLPRVFKVLRCVCPSNGRSFPFDGEIRGAILQAGEEQFLVMGRYAIEAPLVVPLPGTREGIAEIVGMFPFVRVAQSSMPITGVSARAESEESVGLSWSVQGHLFKTTLGKARRPGQIVEEGARQSAR